MSIKVTEPLLQPTERLTLFPIKYPDIWDLYKKAESSFWIAQEVDLSTDLVDWITLSDDERYFIKHVLAFFASSDTVVNMNIGDNFINLFQPLEVKAWYGMQYAIETIHSEAYSLMIDSYIKNAVEKDKLLDAVNTIDCIKEKSEWAQRWVVADCSIAHRLVAFAIVEGIFFSGSFASIFWLKNQNKMSGLCKYNEFISRDEGMHTQFAAHLYKNHIVHRLDESEVHAMVKEAVGIETKFITSSLPCRLINMNSDLMAQYIQFVADWLLKELGHLRLYDVTNPFDFMEKISMQGKQNFFEARPTEYQKSKLKGWTTPDENF